MSDERYDYDPGQPYEPPRRRKRRRDYKRESEYDDAWAAASEAGEDFDDADIEDFAAGYHWEDRDRYGIEGDPDDEPDVQWQRSSRAPRSSSRLPSRDLSRAPRDPSRASSRSADLQRRSHSYHRDRVRQSEYAEYYGPPAAPPAHTPRKRVAEPVWTNTPARSIPYWQILIIVVMAVFALLATAFACASVLMLI